jgi:hypothetical protein
MPVKYPETAGFAAKAHIGASNVKLRSSSQSHKPRNFAKSVIVE